MNRLVLLVTGALVLVIGIVLFLARGQFAQQPSALKAVSQLAGKKSPGNAETGTGKTAGKHEASSASAARKPEVASADSGKAPEKDTTAVSRQPKAKQERPPAPPTFDVVRVEPTGETVIAGRAAPGAKVEVLLDGKVVAAIKADANGEWTFVPERPLFTGSHQLVLRAKIGDRVVESPQAIAVSMEPVKKGEAPLVVLSMPDAPSRVLQQPKPQPRVATAEGTGSAAPENMAATEQEASPATTATAGGETLAGKPAPREAEARKATPAKPVPKAKPGPEPVPVSLALRTVDYDESGQIFFTGRAAPGSALRLYVDNRFLADVRTNDNGEWSWRGETTIAPGRHALRIDRLAGDGSVIERIELPFVRADVRAVAEARAAAGRPELLQKLEREARTEPAPAASGKETPATRVSPAGGEEKPAVGAAQPVGTSGGGEAERASSALAPEAASPDKLQKEEPGASSLAFATNADVKASGTAAGTPSATVSGQGGTTASQAASRKAPGTGFIIVQPGNNLWNISRVIYGRGVRYTTIYEANRDQIRDPDLIYPGQVFRAPGLPPRKITIDPRRRKPLSPEELKDAPLAVQ